jgi:hypothetical protein
VRNGRALAGVRNDEHRSQTLRKGAIEKEIATGKQNEAFEKGVALKKRPIRGFLELGNRLAIDVLYVEER